MKYLRWSAGWQLDQQLEARAVQKSHTMEGKGRDEEVSAQSDLEVEVNDSGQDSDSSGAL
jgi:hypothetical protein